MGRSCIKKALWKRVFSSDFLLNIHPFLFKKGKEKKRKIKRKIWVLLFFLEFLIKNFLIQCDIW